MYFFKLWKQETDFLQSQSYILESVLRAASNPDLCHSNNEQSLTGFRFKILRQLVVNKHESDFGFSTNQKCMTARILSKLSEIQFVICKIEIIAYNITMVQ